MSKGRTDKSQSGKVGLSKNQFNQNNNKPRFNSGDSNHAWRLGMHIAEEKSRKNQEILMPSSLSEKSLGHLVDEKKGIKSRESSKLKGFHDENDNAGEQGSVKDPIQSAQLMKLFEDELKDIYWAEKSLTKTIQKMIRNATSSELIESLNTHMEETQVQEDRLVKIFEMIDKKPVARKCEAMAGLINVADSIMESCEEGTMRDVGIISAAQKIEHYEIASYGTLRQFADILDLKEVVTLLATTLDEEYTADENLSDIATAIINIEHSELEM
jgi:ferritin-like metal-binding protein YciE